MSPPAATKQFVIVISVANLLSTFQQFTVCYIAYNLANRTSYLLHVEKTLTNDDMETEECEDD